MKSSFKYLIAISLTLVLFLTVSSLISQGKTEGSITENVEVISKGKNSKEQCVVLSSDKKIYIKNFSIWALLQEEQDYTVTYSGNGNSREYQLITIVPGDYNGQF